MKGSIANLFFSARWGISRQGQGASLAHLTNAGLFSHRKTPETLFSQATSEAFILPWDLALILTLTRHTGCWVDSGRDPAPRLAPSFPPKW